MQHACIHMANLKMIMMAIPFLRRPALRPLKPLRYLHPMQASVRRLVLQSSSFERTRPQVKHSKVIVEELPHTSHRISRTAYPHGNKIFLAYLLPLVHSYMLEPTPMLLKHYHDLTCHMACQLHHVRTVWLFSSVHLARQVQADRCHAKYAEKVLCRQTSVG